jgi:hypothetical protein
MSELVVESRAEGAPRTLRVLARFDAVAWAT